MYFALALKILNNVFGMFDCKILSCMETEQQLLNVFIWMTDAIIMKFSYRMIYVFYWPVLYGDGGFNLIEGIKWNYKICTLEFHQLSDIIEQWWMYKINVKCNH